jgi:dihydrodipicolinate synthase/N-acetylneuraminate lyase
VNLYGPASLHGFRPTDRELMAYFDEVLGSVNYPVTIAPNPVQGYTPKASLIADVCNRHDQVVAIILNGFDGDEYFIDLKDALKRDLPITVPLVGSLHTFGLGATALSCNQVNVIPKTVRRYVDGYNAGDLETANQAYADLHRFNRYVEQWRGARWQKMALRVLKLPGGEGGLRKPLMMPPDDEVRRFAAGLLELGLAEVDELARAAGLRQEDLASVG